MVVVMASYDPTSTEMNPMYATVQDHPTSQSSLPSVASNRDTATSETALLNQYDQPQKEAKTRSGHPSRLDTENTIYGKGLAEEKEKKVAHFAAEEYSSRDRLWTYTRSCAFLVLPVLACIFAAAVLIVTLLVAFGVLQLAAREQPAAEQLDRLNRTVDSLSRTVARLQAQLDSTATQDTATACPNSTSPPLLPVNSSLLLHTVNLSACVEFNTSCSFSAGSNCATGTNGTSPEFLEERSTTMVTVELGCWASKGGERGSTSLLFANNTLLCRCSDSTDGTGGVCNFYRMECQVPMVEVPTSQQP